MTNKWFGDIPSRKIPNRNLPVEPIQTVERRLETTERVPLDAIYKTYHIPGRHENGYFETDLLSDVLGRGKSSRLNQILVKEKKLFNSISAYSTGSLDPGLLVISGHLNKGVDISTAEGEIEAILTEIKSNEISLLEMQKVKNQAKSTIGFGEVELLNRVMNIAFAANAGDVNYCNQEMEKIDNVSQEDILNMAQKVLKTENCSTLLYKAG